jgi:hypothetical protein
VAPTRLLEDDVDLVGRSQHHPARLNEYDVILGVGRRFPASGHPISTSGV